jgi:hypothetical protein
MVRVSVTLQGDGECRINISSQMGGKRGRLISPLSIALQTLII